MARVAKDPTGEEISKEVLSINCDHGYNTEDFVDLKDQIEALIR